MVTDWKKTFFIIYIGQGFSIIGSAAVQFALVCYLTLQTASPIVLTTSAIVGFIPSAILGPFAGVLIDRYSRRLVMILADGLIAVPSAVLALVFLANGSVSPMFIYIILFIRGVGTTFHTPAMNAAIPSFVPEEQLVKAGGWGSFIISGSNVLGPLLGAFLMEIMTLSSVMMVDVLGAVFAIICLLCVQIPEMIYPTNEKRQFWAELKQGFQEIKKNKLLSIALPQYVATGFFYFPISSLFPLLILSHYKGGAMENGMVDTFFAAGMLISSIILGIWGGFHRKLLTFSIGIAILGIAALIIGILPPYLFWVSLICAFIMGNSAAWFNVPFNAYIQESTPQASIGKVLSLVITACTIANPIGLAISGPVSEVIGVDGWFLLSGFAFIAIAAINMIRTKKPEIAYLEKKAQQQAEFKDVTEIKERT